MSQNPPQITWSTAAANGIIVPTFWSNIPWIPFNNGIIQIAAPSPIPVIPSGGAYTDNSIAALSGASQLLMAANSARHHLIIQNPAATQVGVNLAGGAAVIGGVGTIVLNQYGTIDIDEYPPTNAINVIGTAGATLVAIQG